MTSLAERARKIAEEIILESRQDRFTKATIWLEHLSNTLLSELREVEREVIEDIVLGLREHEISQRIRKEALEQAAEIAQNYEDGNLGIFGANICLGITNKIRALTPCRERK